MRSTGKATHLDLVVPSALPVVAQAPVAVAHHEAAEDQDDEHRQAEEDEREVLCCLQQTAPQPMVGN